MSKIAIDFGTTRTKVACIDKKSGKPQILELGREIRSVLPSLFYIPNKGEVLVGDDAVEEAATDRRGIVRGLKMNLETRTPIRRNKRKIDRIELAAVLFCNIKLQCETLYFHNEKITECVLTIPPLFATSPNKLQAIEEAARLGGFDIIEIVEEPIAAAKHWLAHGNATSDFIFVCDIGGGTTDFALLKKVPETEDFQLFSELQPDSAKVGGNNVDNGIFEQLDLQGVDAQDKDAFLLRIRQYKEYISRSPGKNPKITYKKQTITNIREIILDECAEFIELIKNEIQRFIKKAQNTETIDLEKIPLLLVGGGMHIHGLKESFTEIWPGNVILWTESEHATVLGAIVGGEIGTEAEKARKLFIEAQTLWYKTLQNTNKLDDIANTSCLIEDVIKICNSSLAIVNRYPPAFNLKNVLSSEQKLLDEIDKANTAWENKDFEKVIQLCETAIKFHPQKEDLPLPAVEYYDDDLVTQVMLMQAEAYDAIEDYNATRDLTKSCTNRKPDLKSAYMLRVTTVLKGIKNEQLQCSSEIWERLIKTIDHIFTLDDDNWGFGWSFIPSDVLLKYKAYALFSQNELTSCQVLLSDLIKKNRDDNQQNQYSLHLLISAYVYFKSGKLASLSKLIEGSILGDEKTLRFIEKNQSLTSWIKDELNLLPGWGDSLKFEGSYDLLDTCLKLWTISNDLKSRTTLNSLYQINTHTTYPWRYKNTKIIQHDAEFLISMASVAAENGDDSMAKACLRDLWHEFPNVPLAKILEAQRLKTIIQKNFSPNLSYDCSYKPFDNWVRIKNNTWYRLTKVEIIIHIIFKDQSTRIIHPLKTDQLTVESNAIIPPTESMLKSMNKNTAEILKLKYEKLTSGVFPHVRYGGLEYKALVIATFGAGYLSKKNKIKHAKVEIKCQELELLSNQSHSESSTWAIKEHIR